MNDIRALLKAAARRLNLDLFVSRLHIVAVVVSAVALALMLADRAPAANFVKWLWVGPSLAAGTLLVAALWWSQRRPSEAHVALVVDERLELKEKLSTALHCQGRTDPFAQAAIEDAVMVARDAKTHERLRRRFALTAPRGWWTSPLILVAVMMVSLLDPLNLFRKDAKPDQNVQNAKLQAEQSIDAVVKTIEEKPELAKALGDLGALSKQGTDPNAMRKPEEFTRDALKKFTDLTKKLEEITNGEKGKSNEAVEKALSQIRMPQEGPAKDLAEALAKGDFAQAQQAMKELMAKAENGQLNEEDKKKAAEQLQNIADQLEKLAQQQQQLEQALKQAGMDAKLAGNPQALQQAIQNNPNLNQQQKQQLQQQAKAQQAAQQACKGMGAACQQMAQGMKQGGQQGQAQMGQGAQQMAQQLGQMEQMQQLLQEAQAAANACKGQCQGLGQAMAKEKQSGSGMGRNAGFGNGGKAQYAPTPTGTKAEKANVNTVDGDVIAKMLFEGSQVRGESKAKLVKVMEEAKKGFDEGQTEDQVHVRYRDAQKHYFGELDKLTKSNQPAAAPTPAPAAPSSSDKPAAPAADAPATKTGG